ncbi:MAG: glycosyltransferase [Pseudomonadota bacterium]
MFDTLVAIVVTHNRLTHLKKTLARLEAVPPESLSAIVVVDNASTDGTGAYLAQVASPRCHIRTLAQNTGGAGGFAAGMAFAFEHLQAGWAVVLDDDARPFPEALEVFRHTLPRAEAAVAAAVYLPDGTPARMNTPAHNPFWHLGSFLQALRRGRGGFHLKAADYTGPPQAVDVASFVGLFVSKKAFSMIGGPDPALFVYGDDSIWSLTLRQAGGVITFDPRIAFEHETRASTGQARFRPLWKVYYYHRNLLILYRMAAGVWFWPVLCVILPGWLLRVRHHGGARRAFLQLLGRAVWDGLRRRTGRTHPEVTRLALQDVTVEAPEQGHAEKQ